MKKCCKFYQGLFIFFSLLPIQLFSQNVGIGTNTPNASAALEIRSTDKGILFPRLTTVQRNAISNVPDGLHIFNTDERCLNYYDSLNKIWNCYCADCETVVININSNTCRMDFYNAYAKNSPSKKYLINIAAGVTISGCATGDTALIFSTMPADAQISINNYGTIAGAGGKGGNAAISQGCYVFSVPAMPGATGGSAVSTKTGVIITINNYGIVAGGGGGGGGSAGVTASGSFGGGGGGGAGIVAGPGGTGGGSFTSSPFVGCVGAISYQGQPGVSGQANSGGAGGAGALGGYAGGTGGNRGQPGQNGTTVSGISIAGAAGKAVIGGSGNSIINLTGGQVFGAID